MGIMEWIHTPDPFRFDPFPEWDFNAEPSDNHYQDCASLFQTF